MFKKIANAAKKGAKSATEAAKNPRVAAALTAAAQHVSTDTVRKVSEKTLGKENTDKITKAGEDAYKKADKAIGEGRLSAAARSGRSAFLAAAALPGPGKMTIVHATLAGAAIGLLTKEDTVGDIAKTIFGGDNDNETPPQDATPPAVSEEPKAQTPKAEEPKTPAAPKKPRAPRTPKGPK